MNQPRDKVEETTVNKHPKRTEQNEEAETEPRRTVVYKGREQAAKVAIRTFSNANVSWDSVSEANAAAMGVVVDIYRRSHEDLMRRGVRVRSLTEITRENVHHCKELLRQKLVTELRHLDGIKGNFVVSEKEYLAVSSIQEAEPVPEIIYSNDRHIVSQNQYVFENLWARAIPAEKWIRELEEGTPRHETRIITDPLEILEKTNQMVKESDAYSVSSAPGGLLYAYNHGLDVFKAILDKTRTGRHRGIRWLTTVEPDVIDVAKKFIEMGMTIRHAPIIPTESFGISDKEIGVTISRLEGGRLNSTAIFSNDPSYIDHFALVFDNAWRNSVDALTRIKEIEEGIEEPRLRIIRDANETAQVYAELIGKAKNEILLLLPSSSEFARADKIGVLSALKSASNRGVRVNMISPHQLGKEEIDILEESSRNTKSFVLRKIREAGLSRNTVTILVVDRTHSLIIELEDDTKADFASAIGVATYSTSSSTVKANIRFFERIWAEVEEGERRERLLERERRSRREAQLLQDILTHDIRNYNQVTRLSAELIQAELRNNPKVQVMVRSLLQAVDGSSELLERAKKLGKVISEEHPLLCPIDLRKAIEDSLFIVKQANPEKSIVDNLAVPYGAEVWADDLLIEVFSNIFTNSVKYTEGSKVLIQTEVQKGGTYRGWNSSDERECWKITISDEGRGIPDDVKSKLFERYLSSAKGSGLGMSIVHALVVERYGGRVVVRNRVWDDYRKGSSIEILLPVA